LEIQPRKKKIRPGFSHSGGFSQEIAANGSEFDGRIRAQSERTGPANAPKWGVRRQTR